MAFTGEVEKKVASVGEDEKKKIIILRSCDGDEFEVEEEVVMESRTIGQMIMDNSGDNMIPLPNVDSNILSKVIEYCNKHVHASNYTNSSAGGVDLKNWDAEFVKVDQKTLFDLTTAAYYLNIKGLRDLTCQTVADMMKGKTTEEVRNIFNIKNDFTAEEEANVRKEYQWAFE